MIRTEGQAWADGQTNGQFQALSDRDWLSIARRLKASPQQLRIMRAIIEQEQIVKEIARDLGISPRSVTTQVERLYAKLQVRSHAGLTKRVFEEVLRMREDESA